jgi:hypothetical protein
MCVEEGCEALVDMTWNTVGKDGMLAQYLSCVGVLSEHIFDCAEI